MTVPPADSRLGNDLATWLEALRVQVDAVEPTAIDDLAAARRALESARDDAVGQEQPAVAEALGRLTLLTEVWECLAPEPREATAVASFCEEALRRLVAGLREGRPQDEADWVARESGARWGDYLSLLEPGGPTLADLIDASPPPPSDEGPSIDPGSLFRLITGEASPPPAPTPPRPPRAVKAGTNGHDAEPVPGSHELIRLLTGAIEAQGPPPEPPLVEVDPEIRDVFLADASELFERIESVVLNLGRDGDAESLLDLGRSLHTLKGAAGAVGLPGLARLVHALEDDVERHSGLAPVPAALIDRLHDGLVEIERQVATLRPAPENAPRPAAPSATEPAPALALEGDGTVRVTNERVEELMDLVSELIVRRAPLATQARAIKDFASTARTCRNRLTGTLDGLRDASFHSADDRQPDLAALTLRLAEQVEDLALLVESAQGAAIPLADEADGLAQLTLRIWEALQAIRVVPVRSLFQRLARVAREAAKLEKREVEVETVGTEVTMDRSVQERVFEPLLHVVRNAVGHGIEAPEVRRTAGKRDAGKVVLEAHREGNTMVLAVRDDGRGLDYDAILAKGRRLGLLGPTEAPGRDRLRDLVFQPGFSTRLEANAVAGRGIGMDVVAREVARLRGTVHLDSRPGHGTVLTIRLPARLWLEQAMVVRVGGQPFALPLETIEDARPFDPGDSATADGTLLFRGYKVPWLLAREALGLAAADGSPTPKALLLRVNDRSQALVVDGVDGPRELVVRPLNPLVAGHPLISGTSLSPTGELIYRLEPSGLGPGRSTAVAAVATRPTAKALVVDDSLSVRRVAARHLRDLGLDVEEASDGVEAIRKLRNGPYRVILTDLEMPRMDGFELLEELRRLGTMAQAPVVVTSTRTDPATQRKALDLGARAFVPKPAAAAALVGVIRPLLATEAPSASIESSSPTCVEPHAL